MFNFLYPHLIVESVTDLPVARLRELGIDSLLLDVDCTLTRFHSHDLAPEVAAWLDALRAAGVGMCLVSNGRPRRIGQLAAKLGLEFVSQALKPFPFGCRAAVRKMGFDPARTAMVGDQVFADIAAGRLAGLRGILVRPIHPEEEPWFTRLKRPMERCILRRIERRGTARS